MKRFVPNVAPPGNDLCLDPVAIQVPVVLVDNGSDCFWYPHPLDEAGVKRVAFTLGNSCQHEVIPMNVELILPSAYDICAVTHRLDSLRCQPVRATLETGRERE